jgi:hypothetical protein
MSQHDLIKMFRSKKASGAWPLGQKAGTRQDKPLDGIEVRKNLPQSWAALEKTD